MIFFQRFARKREAKALAALILATQLGLAAKASAEEPLEGQIIAAIDQIPLQGCKPQVSLAAEKSLADAGREQLLPVLLSYCEERVSASIRRRIEEQRALHGQEKRTRDRGISYFAPPKRPLASAPGSPATEPGDPNESLQTQRAERSDRSQPLTGSESLPTAKRDAHSALRNLIEADPEAANALLKRLLGDRPK